MAELRKIAGEFRDEIMDGIVWVAVWKTGRSWNGRVFWLDEDGMIEDSEMDSAREIVAEDGCAVLINEHYCAHMGNGTIGDIAKGIRFHYGNGYNRLAESTAYRPRPADCGEDGEFRLLSGSTDKYGIYQLKDGPELDRFRFESSASLVRSGITDGSLGAIQPTNYELVYSGNLSGMEGTTQKEKLEEIFIKLNISHPEGYKGHSLSVSDVVVMHESGENRAYFVDSFGFILLPAFMCRLLERHGMGSGQAEKTDGNGPVPECRDPQSDRQAE
jgi:hypothetical protein